ncbi:TPA: hypothetical protein QDZ84_003495 [Shewanella algae]|uniref:hypothetical protein n=1 Tax=Shewanella TaxID=22 RepID=UPI001431368C|nr:MULTISPECIES: hypothetical protein [Shewanella]NJI86962.1 hypothetical protein [Shewanella sp. Iso12]HDS1208456.1 hypothetical protein [Shewanella algae]
MRVKKVYTVIWISFCFSIFGCSVNQDPYQMSHSGPDMVENYKSHTLGTSESMSDLVNSTGYIYREFESDVNNIPWSDKAYRRVDNPELRMFIYPHRSTRMGVVVPGYYINFPMFEKIHYNLEKDVINDR